MTLIWRRKVKGFLDVVTFTVRPEPSVRICQVVGGDRFPAEAQKEKGRGQRVMEQQVCLGYRIKEQLWGLRWKCMLNQGCKDKDPLESCLPTLMKRYIHSLACGEKKFSLHCLLTWLFYDEAE